MTAPPLLRVEGLVKSYGGVRAVDGVSLEVRPGEVVCLIGPSGSGKSTFLRCLNALERADSGRVLFAGEEVDPGRRDIRRLRRRMGMVFQNFELFPHLTALRNVAIGPVTVLGMERAKAEMLALELLRKVGLSDHAAKHPAQLSGGQQQRVAIARALVTRPTVLFADEPTGNLDSRTGEEILALLRDSVDAYGQTTLMVTHEARAAAMADRVLFLADGLIVKDVGKSSAADIHSAMNELSR